MDLSEELEVSRDLNEVEDSIEEKTSTVENEELNIFKEPQNSELHKETKSKEQSIEENTSSDPSVAVKTTEGTKVQRNKQFTLPLARVKNIMKMDPDCHMIGQEALLSLTKATVKIQKLNLVVKSLRSL